MRVDGAKNSVLKLMAATLLAPGRSVITNVPRILDVSIMCELLGRLGCGIDYDPEAGNYPHDPAAAAALLDEAGVAAAEVATRRRTSSSSAS